MKRYHYFLTALLLFCVLTPLSAQDSRFPILKGQYLGQKPPGMKPELFAPGIISTGFFDRDTAMTPDGKEFYYSIFIGKYAFIMVTRQENGRWTEPTVASFSRDLHFFNVEPCISYDGKKLFFLSNRPKKGENPKPGWTNQDIRVTDRQLDGSWGEPYNLGAPVDTEDGEFFPSITENGTLYFARTKKGTTDSMIYRSGLVDNKYTEPERLPDSVNGRGNIYNAFIARDESYLIGCCPDHPDNITRNNSEYYVFFRKKDGSWTEGINLGAEINVPGGNALSPYVTPDGKYFFFSSSRTKEGLETLKNKLTLGLMRRFDALPQNGRSDLYWIDAKVITSLKPPE